jgi:hypothetical protein
MPKVLEDCVKALVDKGKEKESAYAICTAQLQKAGILKPDSQELAEGCEGKTLFLQHDDGTIDAITATEPPKEKK